MLIAFDQKILFLSPWTLHFQINYPKYLSFFILGIIFMGHKIYILIPCFRNILPHTSAFKHVSSPVTLTFYANT